MDSNEEEEVVFDQPTTLTGRRDIANEFCSASGFTLPTVIDDMANTVDKAYAAWPERMFIIDTDGLIVYAAAQGPWGFRPKHIKRWLRKNLGRP